MLNTIKKKSTNQSISHDITNFKIYSILNRMFVKISVDY